MLKIKIPEVVNPIFTTTLDVRIGDINYGNHLGHDSVVTLMQEARVRFLKSLGYGELNIDGYGMLITNLAVNYKNEAFHGDQITASIELSHLSSRSFELIYQFKLTDSKKEIARAMTTSMIFDYKQSKVAMVPEGFVRAIQS